MAAASELGQGHRCNYIDDDEARATASFSSLCEAAMRRTPSFLRAICSILSFGIAEFAVRVCSSDTNKTDGCRELLRVFSMRRENFSGKSGIEPISQVIGMIYIFKLVPLAGIEPALLAELDFESSASTNSATGAFGRPGREASVAKRAEYSGRLCPVNPRTAVRSGGRGTVKDRPKHRPKHCGVNAPASTAPAARDRTLGHAGYDTSMDGRST